jgi:deazaflavin-dependent oxidoreductase (nitroreductase family)
MTTFDARPGTRGARQPRGRFVQWINGFVARRVRKGGKNPPGLNFDILLLTTTGRKSGQERTSPLGWVPDGNGGWLIAASANGAPGLPAWYHNLAAAPDQARIEVGGATIPVSAEQLHGTEREAAWQTLTTGIPRFGGYAEKTDREIPVIRLTPRPS